MSRIPKSRSRDTKFSNKPGKLNNANTELLKRSSDSNNRNRTINPPKNIPDNERTEPINLRAKKLKTINDIVKQISDKLDKEIEISVGSSNY